MTGVEKHPFKRNERLDGLKFILVVLVAVGHFSEPYRYSMPAVGSIYSCIYLFHIPLFAMLSGFFCKGLTFEKITKTIINTWQAYTMMALVCFLLVNRHWRILIVPATSYWYLMSLIWWKLMLWSCHRVVQNNKMTFLLSLVAIPIAVYYINRQSELLAIMKTLCFFPFFVCGSLLDEINLKKIRQYKHELWFGSTVFMILIFWVSSRFIHELEWHRKGMIQILIEYDKGFVSFWGWLIVIYVGSFVSSFALLAMNRMPMLYCKLGAHSLLFYVLQDMIWNFSKRFTLSLVESCAFVMITILIGIGIYYKGYEKYIIYPFSSILSFIRK